jgi:hypothetical protein
MIQVQLQNWVTTDSINVDFDHVLDISGLVAKENRRVF